MKRKVLLITLAAALLLSVSALAAEGQPTDPDSAPVQSQEDARRAEGDADAAPEAGEPPAGETGEPDPEPEEEYIPDPVGSISFKNLERRMREGNLSMLALEENIQSIQVIDFDKMYEDIRKSLNQIANAQWMMVMIGQEGSYASTALEQSYSSLRNTFEDLKDGEIQKDYADAIRQLENAQDQMVMAGESMYVALADLEVTERSLDRSLEAMDRTLQELELRYQLGQISSLTLKQAQAGRASLISGRETLRMNAENLRTQLELMIGAELTGQLQLGPLPDVTGGQLAAMDLEADLEKAEEASYSLYAAQLTLEDARDTWKDAALQNHYDEKRYQYQAAQHSWQAAQHTYNATVQNFETSFRTLYLQVKDYEQVLAAARTSLAVEQDSFAATQLKFEQGTISQNALLEAQDKVSEARDTVDGAVIDLFSAYHKYCWAVEHGILN